MYNKIKRQVKTAIFSSNLSRTLLAWLLWITRRTKPVGTSHLSGYREEDAIGPLQQSEALLLFAIVRTTAPKTIVEFGFLNGHSSWNFLKAGSEDMRLFSYDISDDSRKIAAGEISRDRRFKFVFKSQTEFHAEDIEHRKIDIVFFDASHNLKANLDAYGRIRPLLCEDSLVCIHDTGLWTKSRLSERHWAFIKSQGENAWIDERDYAHQNEERKFVNALLSREPELQAIHFHSTNVLRHGLTILQARRVLTTADNPQK